MAEEHAYDADKSSSASGDSKDNSPGGQRTRPVVQPRAGGYDGDSESDRSGRGPDTQTDVPEAQCRQM